MISVFALVAGAVNDSWTARIYSNNNWDEDDNNDIEDKATNIVY